MLLPLGGPPSCSGLLHPSLLQRSLVSRLDQYQWPGYLTEFCCSERLRTGCLRAGLELHIIPRQGEFLLSSASLALTWTLGFLALGWFCDGVGLRLWRPPEQGSAPRLVSCCPCDFRQHPQKIYKTQTPLLQNGGHVANLRGCCVD